MRTKRRITRAYCIELKTDVTIAGARRAYFSLPEPRQRFKFLCSTPECRELPIKPKVTAANYHVHPSEDSAVYAPHFKDNGKYEHHPDCEWVTDDDDLTPRAGESELDTKTRLARRQLKSMIDIFDPNPEPDEPMPRVDQQGEGGTAQGGSRQSSPSNQSGTRKNSPSSSKDLRRLVDAYTEAKETLPSEVFRNLKITVKGQGQISLRSYFLPAMYAKCNTAGRVYWGRAELLPRFGESIVFKLTKGIGDKMTLIKVSAATFKAYKSKGYINDLLLHAPGIKWFTVYFFGVFEHDPEKNIVNGVVTDLRRLAIDLGPKKANASVE
ncbi:hypothetical protein ALP36_02012 [Pseudomonas syringae pv. coriandricola]|uniref:ATPase n=1 Tax=Pseudomonas syringae pv. coriandricola TaxID=264453 RepID=A0A3M5RGR9_9PSED|nr:MULTISPECIES: ATPase [Pseudomonas syringae group]RMR37949.1 hypothetical protein ALP87_03397 [Pseudomonas syringae pv. coriandricola]RMU08279.1 hypothetical protein ALP36_02012 [Pseudomonas syringae pv. coriandricola]